MAVAAPQSMNGAGPGMGSLSSTDSDFQQYGPGPMELDLQVPLDDLALDRLGRHLRWEIDRYYQETLGRRGNCEQWRRDFELFPQGPSTRWPNASNVTAPLTHIYCQSHTTRLNQQICKSSPPMAVVARSPYAQQYVPDVEDAMEAILEAARWETIANEVHSELPIVGNVFLRVTYEQDYVHSPKLVHDWDLNAFQALVAAGSPPMDAFVGALKTDADGRPAMGIEWVNRLTHSGTKYKVIPWEDGVLIPASVRDPEDARGIGERLFIRGHELAAGARTGKYIKKQVDQLLQRHSDDMPSDRYERLQHQGITSDPGSTDHGGEPDPSYRDYLCYELCWQGDFNDDGELEWVVVTLHHETSMVLRCQWLPYEHGRPYYMLFRYFTRARELWGMSVAEKLASIQDAATAVLNQILDHADLVLNLHGNFFYDGTADFDPNKNVVRLGQPIRVGNVEGVKVIDVGQLLPEHYNVYQMLKDMADLITASSNPSLGRTTDTQKTLGEIQIVAGASNMIFEEIASGVARDWGVCWDMTRWLEGQFGEDGEVYYRSAARPARMFTTQDGPQPGASVGGQSVPAQNGVAFASIPADILLSDIDLVPTGLKQLADMQSRTQQATIVQNTALMHPLLAQNLPALAIILDEFFQSIRFPKREQVMAEVQKSLQAQMQVQQAQAMMQSALGGQMGSAGAGQSGPGAGPTPPARNPTMQGPRGNPANGPTGPAGGAPRPATGAPNINPPDATAVTRARDFN